ncbi:MAG: hypothetical protein RR630_09235 [Coprobacillus sp.]
MRKKQIFCFLASIGMMITTLTPVYAQSKTVGKNLKQVSVETIEKIKRKVLFHVRSSTFCLCFKYLELYDRLV